MSFYSTMWSLLPAIIAIVFALITKEVYSSLFLGILTGGLLYANFNIVAAIEHIFIDGIMGSYGESGIVGGAISDPYNVGILIFLVMLGTLVALMDKAGGSRSFGIWASKHIKSKVGAQLATILLGVLIFVDDYFNCLTVGSVMRPVTDKFNVNRAKLAYLIDATAAPVCIIAPISSWAAAVSGFVEGTDGISLFIRSIPYNFYAILTLVMIIAMVKMNFEYGTMKKEIESGQNNISSANDTSSDSSTDKKGKVYHLVVPVILLIICCVIGMIYSGGFFKAGEEGYQNFIIAFSNSDASIGLVFGSFVALILTIVLYCMTRVLSFRDCMDALPEGFKSMVPAILILTLAWTLKNMTDSLGAKEYVANIVSTSASSFMNFLPAIIFLIACVLSFSTGTSWGTFGILIPIVVSVFSGDMNNELMIISISACMAGSVCGDHCSPISDTTIMSSAGAKCEHIKHVSTQLPYAITCLAVSFVAYIITGFVRNWIIMLPISAILMILVLAGIKKVTVAKS